MIKLKIFTVFLAAVTLAALLVSPAASALSAGDVAADAVLVIETKSGKILCERNKDIRVAPGSIAKVMTLLLTVLEIESGQAGRDDIVTASDTFLNGLGENDAKQDITPGETISCRDLMYCAYIASANDACNILAEEIGGSITGFVRKMNAKAEELGCRDTHFTNPGGLSDPGQYTSAWDQYLIFKEAVSHPLFVEIAGTASYKAPADDDSPERSFMNPNLMLQEQSTYFYRYCAAGKTASSNEYGSSLVSYAANDELSLIAVVFGVKSDEGDSASDAAKSFSETIRLLDWAISGFAWHDIVNEYDILANEQVTLAEKTDTIDLKPTTSITILARKDLTAADIRKDVVIFGQAEGKVLSAPLKKGDILGELTVIVDGEVCARVDLVASRDVSLDRGAFIASQIKETLSILWVRLVIFFLIALMGFYIWLVIRDYRNRREKKRRILEARKQIIEQRKRQKINK
jgi:D-alanyl-D-alanine carboxypeptidase (penicillin-binding protein 5/6)